jgi:hypothetical protein
VRFSRPVAGPDSYAGKRTIDDRHEFQCAWLRHHGEDTLFGIEDEIIERWPTALIEMVEWRVESGIGAGAARPRGPTRSQRRAENSAPRLGERWTPEEDEELRREHGGGVPPSDIARAHGRNHGGIVARLARLGLDAGDAPDMPT